MGCQLGERNRNLSSISFFYISIYRCPYFAFDFLLQLFLFVFVFFQVEIGAAGHRQLLDQSFHLLFLLLFLLHLQLLVLPPVIDDTLWS